MTLHWMDVARYGDSSVHHADGPRTMRFWRDWVINAYHTKSLKNSPNSLPVTPYPMQL